MTLPRVQVDGRLTADPELRFTPSGFAVANFTVAGNDRVKKKDGSDEWEDGPTTFLRCSVWREQAENVAESLRKGDGVLVTGKLTQREYEHEGQKRTAFEVQVETIGPSLRWRSVPHGQRTERTSAPQEGAGDAWASVPRVPPARIAGPDAGAQQPVQPAQQPPVQQQPVQQQPVQQQPVMQPAQGGGWVQQYDEPPF